MKAAMTEEHSSTTIVFAIILIALAIGIIDAVKNTATSYEVGKSCVKHTSDCQEYMFEKGYSPDNVLCTRSSCFAYNQSVRGGSDEETLQKIGTAEAIDNCLESCKRWEWVEK